MELKLKQNRGFFSQKNIIANEQIELVSDIDSKFDVYITFKNNDIKARIKVNHVFSIPAEVFIDGILESNVEVYFQGNLIKRIPCDRLIIQNVDNSLKAIPDSVTSIGNQAFAYCYSIIKYDFTSATSIPTLSSTDAFTDINGICKIYVPDALYDDWIVATNWATYADYIYKASEMED